MEKYTTEKVIDKLQKIYHNRYDYSKVKYINSKTPISLICSKHGEFKLRLDHALEGQGCKLCKQEENNTEKLQKFIKLAREIHGDKYIYNKVNFSNKDNKGRVCIICPKHGEFWQTPVNHIIMKQGCQKCYHESRVGKYNMTTEEFIEKAKKIHGNKYIYTNTTYHGIKNKVKIICPIHGEFEQVAYDHLKGFGCEKCKFLKNTLTLEQFVQRARKIHGDKYDYSKVKYVNNHTKICIICPIHGEFWQTPLDHLIGCGCQKCHSSRLEEEIRVFLNEKNINFIEQKKFPWLGKLSLDFYIPEYNCAIECQGLQHFEECSFGNKISTETFEKRIERDKRKRMLCQENSLKLLYFSNLCIDYPYKVFENKNELLEEIKKEVKP